MSYAVYRTDSFEKEMKGLSQDEQERIKNIFLQLKDNPYVGNQLKIKTLREKRLSEKRIYYLVFDDLNAVLMVAIRDKKKQQKTINYILRYIDEYRIYLEGLFKK